MEMTLLAVSLILLEMGSASGDRPLGRELARIDGQVAKTRATLSKPALQKIQELSYRLSGFDLERRGEAARLLKAEMPTSFWILVPLLKSPNPRIVVRACEFLTESGTRELLESVEPVFFTLLQSEDPEMQTCALRVYAGLSVPAALIRLLALAQNSELPSTVRAAALDALGAQSRDALRSVGREIQNLKEEFSRSIESLWLERRVDRLLALIS